MPTIKDFTKEMESFAPAELAESWDNVGTLVEATGEIKKVLFVLDITKKTVEEAIDKECQLIVAHHPVIFKPLKSIDSNNVVFTMVQHNISAICAHTNLDSTVGGVNDVLAALFGVTQTSVFSLGGRIGKLPEPTSATEFAQYCSKLFGTQVKFVDAGKPIQTIAMLGGSGGSFLQDAIEAGADCYLTGEAGHHNAIDAAHAGISLVAAGHFSTEFPAMAAVANHFKNKFPSVEMVISQQSKDPFSYC